MTSSIQPAGHTGPRWETVAVHNVMAVKPDTSLLAATSDVNSLCRMHETAKTCNLVNRAGIE